MAGNVRELANVIERAMIHSTGNTLVLDDVAVRSDPVQRAKPARSKRWSSMSRMHCDDAAGVSTGVATLRKCWGCIPTRFAIA